MGMCMCARSGKEWCACMCVYMCVHLHAHTYMLATLALCAGLRVPLPDVQMSSGAYASLDSMS